MGEFVIGAGKAEIDYRHLLKRPLMGFNDENQIAEKVIGQLAARAFVIETDGNLIALVVADIWSGTESIRTALLKRLKGTELGARLSGGHLMVAGTHTHSGPSGITDHRLYAQLSGGYSQAVVDDIALAMCKALQQADQTRRPARIEILDIVDKGDAASGAWFGNRSLEAYKANPEAERNRHRSAVEKNFATLLFREADTGALIGSLNFLAVHGTALGPDNRNLSGDIPGNVSTHIEGFVTRRKLAGAAPFVAGSLNGCCGDISPNMKASGEGYVQKRQRVPHNPIAQVEHWGEEAIDWFKGLFAGNHAPPQTEEEGFVALAEEIGAAFAAAHGAPESKTHLASFPTTVEGEIHAAYGTPDMTDWQDGDKRTWRGAVGLSTLAGAVMDGPGPLGLREGITTQNASITERGLWSLLMEVSSRTPKKDIVQLVGPIPNALTDAVVGLLKLKFDMDTDAISVGADYVGGQAPKPVAILTRRISPESPPKQVFWLGPILIAALPGEMTTMAGRRLRDALGQVCNPSGQRPSHVLTVCYANDYCQYVTTPEEYDCQHYEGASTLFGRHTLDAHVAHLTNLARA
ncbi:neutral/alkaline non-lysosomal ceramidase N-terminal domain-containing protein [Antarctobacter heliothermus]|uniref:Neutral ceramidase n=1 Tax=Antarctobacter heliothermus TaxID=74033 RepID=A0A239FLG5_9RHOB|nr:neutral/alkaline non-lysosomal ceramidase N-terminal domain-containing protein [Antarctobacter heliothermus]SNS57641.1 Neutral/alkaline non-lysosomal ceramidase, N-terminal [Antarctobacter heliothermus]